MIHFVITIVFDFSWDDCYTQEILDYGYSKFGGGGEEGRGRGKVYYGRCENGKLFWIANHSLTLFRFFSPCIKTANQQTGINHEDAFGRA